MVWVTQWVRTHGDACVVREWVELPTASYCCLLCLLPACCLRLHHTTPHHTSLHRIPTHPPIHNLPQEFLAPELGKAGYTGVYKKKTAELYTRAAFATDGCATFFRRERFGLVKKYEVSGRYRGAVYGGT